jgi:hypothetical protein
MKLENVNKKIHTLYYMAGLLQDEKTVFTGTDEEEIHLNNSIEFVEGWLEYYQEQRKNMMSRIEQ